MQIEGVLLSKIFVSSEEFIQFAGKLFDYRSEKKERKNFVLIIQRLFIFFPKNKNKPLLDGIDAEPNEWRTRVAQHALDVEERRHHVLQIHFLTTFPSIPKIFESFLARNFT